MQDLYNSVLVFPNFLWEGNALNEGAILILVHYIILIFCHPFWHVFRSSTSSIGLNNEEFFMMIESCSINLRALC